MSSARSTRISPSRAWRATSFSSATRPIASSGSSAGRCASRTRRASRRTFRSGSAKRRAAPTSCPPPSRACAPRSQRGSPPTVRAGRHGAGSPRRSASPRAAADQLVEYLAAASPRSARCRRRRRIVFERFFDEAGGMQLVIHSPFGSRLNRAWGLALRKRFCRKFNFELQAAATEDNIVLSLTTAHSFELDDVARYLHSTSVRHVLIQAMLDAPMFTTRWRWVAGVSLALPRFRGGKKVPPQLLRMQAEDLVAAVFPDQIACAENLAGEREVPDHPLTNQAIADCLHEAMDIEGLERLLGASRRARSRSSARPDRAFAARARGAVGEALRLPRRRAARGAPHAGRHGAALARPGERVRPRPARSRGDRQGSGRGLARSGQRRGAARRAALARLPDRRRGPRRARLERMARGAGAREARRAAQDAAARLYGFRPSG